MASETDICNRALQKLGAKRISSLSEDSNNARACHASYEIILNAELELHPWNFAIGRAELAADAVAPEWGKANSFQLPEDFLRILPPDPEDNFNDRDWQIEGKKIVTNELAPLFIRYIRIVDDTTYYPASFIEAFATKIAYELCEQITQSNTKKDSLDKDYEKIIRRARKSNAIQNKAAEAPIDTWITGRL